MERRNRLTIRAYERNAPPLMQKLRARKVRPHHLLRSTNWRIKLGLTRGQETTRWSPVCEHNKNGYFVVCREIKEAFVCMQWQIELPGTLQACIAPGSIIISSRWVSYQGMQTMTGMKYVHHTVNHTKNFLDPTTGAHTQTPNLSGTPTRCRISTNAAQNDL